MFKDKHAQVKRVKGFCRFDFINQQSSRFATVISPAWIPNVHVTLFASPFRSEPCPTRPGCHPRVPMSLLVTLLQGWRPHTPLGLPASRCLPSRRQRSLRLSLPPSQSTTHTSNQEVTVSIYFFRKEPQLSNSEELTANTGCSWLTLCWWVRGSLPVSDHSNQEEFEGFSYPRFG